MIDHFVCVSKTGHISCFNQKHGNWGLPCQYSLGPAWPPPRRGAGPRATLKKDKVTETARQGQDSQPRRWSTFSERPLAPSIEAESPSPFPSLAVLGDSHMEHDQYHHQKITCVVPRTRGGRCLGEPVRTRVYVWRLQNGRMIQEPGQNEDSVWLNSHLCRLDCHQLLKSPVGDNTARLELETVTEHRSLFDNIMSRNCCNTWTSQGNWRSLMQHQSWSGGSWF